MSVKLLTEHNLEFLSLKGGYTGLSAYQLVKMPHCSKSHVVAHFKTSRVNLDQTASDNDKSGRNLLL